MKKTKTITGITALAMSVTMIASTAASVSAETAYDSDGNVIGDGGFYTIWEDTNGDGTVDGNDEYTKAPTKYGVNMYDGTISSIVRVKGSSTSYTVTLQSISLAIVSGSITSIKDSKGNELLNGNTAILDNNGEYTMKIDAKLLGATVHKTDKQVKFKVV